MKSSDVLAKIEEMGGLPSLPQTLLNIQKVASDNRSSADDLAECILRDQALTMRVLKVVNSAMYRRRNREQVRTVSRAVVVMGFDTVRQLALGLSVFDMMSKLSRSPLLADIARHSLVAAGFAQLLAEVSGKAAPEEAFVAALVHDIGKIVLIECSPEVMDQVQAAQDSGENARQAEKLHFGLSHDRAGRRLAARWGLPATLQQIIRRHHEVDPLDPPENLDPLLGAIVYANAMAHFTCAAGDQARENRILVQSGRVLGIPADRLDGIFSRVGDEISELARYTGVEVGDLVDYGSIVNVDGSANVAPRRMGPAEIARRTAEQLALYQEVGLGLAEGRDPKILMQMILQGAVDILDFARVVFFRVDRAAKLLRPEAWAGGVDPDLAGRLVLPLKMASGAVALAQLEHRAVHITRSQGEIFSSQAGQALLEATDCSGLAAVPVATPEGVAGVLYGDGGPAGAEVVAEQVRELQGLALQIGLVVSSGRLTME